MTFLLIMAAYFVAGVVQLPWLARWELAGLESTPGRYLSGGEYVRTLSKERLLRVAATNAAWKMLIWPAPLLHRAACHSIMRDHAQAVAAKQAELDIAEHRRIIKAYDAAQQTAFDRALNQPVRKQ